MQPAVLTKLYLIQDFCRVPMYGEGGREEGREGGMEGGLVVIWMGVHWMHGYIKGTLDVWVHLHSWSVP